jgi:hypothetical protein
MARLLLPDKDPHAVSALRNKRADIAGQIATHNAEIVRLRGELMHLDAVLRLFDPETEPTDISALRRWPKKTEWFARGEIAQRVYDALRANETVAPSELANQAISDKGWQGIGWIARKDIVARFSSILYTMTRRGQLVKIGHGQGVRWRLAPVEPDLL